MNLKERLRNIYLKLIFIEALDNDNKERDV